MSILSNIYPYFIVNSLEFFPPVFCSRYSHPTPNELRTMVLRRDLRTRVTEYKTEAGEMTEACSHELKGIKT